MRKMTNTWLVYTTAKLATVLRPPPFLRAHDAANDCLIFDNFSADDRTAASHGPDHHALILGPADCDSSRLESALTAAANHDQRWTWFRENVRGAYFGLVITPGSLRVWAMTAGIVQIHYAIHRDGILVSNSAVLLAATMQDTTVDREVLAGYLFENPPTALAMRPLLTRVHTIPPAHELLVSGRTTQVRKVWDLWPQRPLSTDEAAPAIRKELTDAVRARTSTTGGRVACDLSGGLDSTSLAFLAAGLTNRLDLYTGESTESIGEDLHWAEKAAKHLSHVSWKLLPAEGFPLPLDDLDRFILPLDRPTFGQASAARWVMLLNQTHRDGAVRHLKGHGGDQLFSGVAALAHDIDLHHSLASGQQISSVTQTRNWTWRATLRALADRRGHRRWWLDQRDAMFSPVDSPTAYLGWAQPCRLQSWITPEGRRLASSCLTRVADEQPLAPSRGKSAWLEAILSGARQLGAMNQLASYFEVADCQVPFYDLGVVSAALAAKTHDVCPGYEYKPLLRSAMKSAVPEYLLARVSKDDASISGERGLRQNIRHLNDIWSDSRLAETGLVDIEALRRLCANPSSRQLADGAVFATLGCELWLRGLEQISSWK